MLEEYIEKLKPRVIEIFGEDRTGHNVDHLERTMKLALKIQEKEGGDRLIIGVAAYLHDVHRIIQIKENRYVEPRETLPMIEQILEGIDFPKEKINAVLNVIEKHEAYNWNNENEKVKDIETLIVQDADNLDAIGAIGVARLFAYGAINNITMYDPQNVSFEVDYAEVNGNDDTSIGHFYHKLVHLGEYMNTKTAKEIAKDRTEFQKEFVERFINEWNGLK